MRVLTLDSNLRSREAAIRILGRNGYDAQSAQVAEEALEMLSSATSDESYGLVIVNLESTIDSQHMIDEIKAVVEKYHSEAKFIGFLPSKLPEKAPDTSQLGMDSIVSEPLNEIELIKAIKLVDFKDRRGIEQAGEDLESEIQSDVLDQVLKSFDWNPAGIIERFGSDHAFFVEMLRYYSDQLIYRLIDMERSIQTASARSLAISAHAVAAGAKEFDQADLEDISRRLGDAAADKAWEEIEQLFEVFQEVCLEKVYLFGTYLASTSCEKLSAKAG